MAYRYDQYAMLPSSDRRGVWVSCDLGSAYMSGEALAALLDLDANADPVEFIELEGLARLEDEEEEERKILFLDGMALEREEAHQKIRLSKSTKIFRDNSERRRAEWLDRFGVVDLDVFAPHGESAEVGEDGYGNRRRFRVES